MTDDNNQNNNEPQEPKNKNQNEKIPLWLQGLQEHEDEDTNPIDVDKSSVETWISEVSKETEDDANAFSAESDEEKQTQPATTTFPDWLTELSQINPGKPIVLDQQDEGPSPEQVQEQKVSLTQGEDSGEVEIEQIPQKKMPEGAEEDFKERPTNGDEFVQADLAEVEITESIDKNINEDISHDEELPPWLQEMISEPQEGYPDQPQAQDETFEDGAAESSDEPTEPVVLSGEPAISEETPGVEEEINSAEWVELEEESEKVNLTTEIEQEYDDISEFENTDAEENDIDLIPEQTPSEWVPEDIGVSNINYEEEPSPADVPATIIEGDTQPIDLSVETPEKEVNQEVEPQVGQEQIKEETVPDPFQQNHQEQNRLPENLQKADEEQIIEEAFPDPYQQDHQEQDRLPENLREIQELLSRNEIEEAVERISASDDRSTYSQEIQTWLLNASNTAEKPNVNYWELLGDVALENEDHDLAFNAYTKGIKSLLGSKEENDEIG